MVNVFIQSFVSPFLQPVNTKRYSEYLKIVEKPMDLKTMKQNLVNGYVTKV